jgi:hypothetical protein
MKDAGANTPVFLLVAQLEDSMDNLKIPTIPKELLEVLEKRFPDKSPDLTDNIDAIRFNSGQVQVVRFLRYHFNLQNQNILEN